MNIPIIGAGNWNSLCFFLHRVALYEQEDILVSETDILTHHYMPIYEVKRNTETIRTEPNTVQQLLYYFQRIPKGHGDFFLYLSANLNHV